MDGYTKVIDGLNGLLADGTVFYQKLRHYHWNVSGTEFFTLHAKFEELYTAWALHNDAVAERILMLRGVPLHTLAALLRAAHIEEDETVPAAPAMVDALVGDMELLRTRAADVLELAEQAGDRGTTNLLDDVCDALEKDAWMLGAWKKEPARSWS
jgi:starvation-inducible DNA-binding protein